MSASSRARIDSIVTEPFDPVYGLQTWDDDDPPQHQHPPQHDNHHYDHHHNDPTTATATATPTAVPQLGEPGFGPTCPFEPFQSHPPPRQTSSTAPGWQAGPDVGFYVSPEQSPHLQPTANVTAHTTVAEYPLDVVSPLSPPATYSSHPGSPPRRADAQVHLLPHASHPDPLADRSSGYPYSPYSHSSLHPRSPSRSQSLQTPRAAPRDFVYTNFEKPPPAGDATAPTTTSPPAFGGVGSSSSGGGGDGVGGGGDGSGAGHRRHASQGVMRRHGSMAQRLGSRLMGTVRRSRSSAPWGSGARRSVLPSNLEGVGGGGGGDNATYMELRERDRDADDDDAIPVDISTFGPEFAVPQAAARAMEEHRFDDLAYTGLYPPCPPFDALLLIWAGPRHRRSYRSVQSHGVQ